VYQTQSVKSLVTVFLGNMDGENPGMLDVKLKRQLPEVAFSSRSLFFLESPKYEGKKGKGFCKGNVVPYTFSLLRNASCAHSVHSEQCYSELQSAAS
jgi:hypothetical protein